MASNLRKLDAQRSIHVGPPSSEGLDLGQAGMFREEPARYHVDEAAASAWPLTAPQVLRQRWAKGELDEPALLAHLAHQNGLETVDLAKAPPDPALQELLDPQFCLRHQVVPWRSHDGILVCATARPEHYVEIVAPLAYRLRREMRLGLRPVIATREQIQQAAAQHHRERLVQQMSSRVPASESCRTWSVTRHRLRLTFALLGLLLLALALHPGAVLVTFTGWAVLTLLLAMMLKAAAAATHLLAPPRPELSREMKEATCPISRSWCRCSANAGSPRNC